MADFLGRGSRDSAAERRLTRALRRRQRSRQSAPRHARLQLEALEPRRVLTNRVILDFTPDVIAGEYSVGRYLEIFDGSSVSDANRFLDYNGDNVVDSVDAKLSVKKIGARVTKLLGDFAAQSDVELEVGFTTNLTAAGDPGLGEKLLAAGQDSSFTNTYVIYVGSDSPRPNHDDLGFAHQAFAGENTEFYAFAFARPIQEFLASGDYPWKKVAKLTPLDFTNNVAFAILHELGHLWGLGHLRDVDATPANVYMPNQYHHLMNYPRQANPDLARFRNDSDHPMEIGSRTLGVSYQTVNAWNEVHNSLRENLVGVFAQTTTPNSQYPEVPTYKAFLGGAMNFGDENPAPSPVTSAPAASQGTRGTTSAADVADLLDAGFQSLRTDLLDDFAGRFNLPADSLPLMSADLADLLGLEAALESVVDAASFSSATSMTQLRSQLIGAGFNVHSALTDAQLAAAPANQPVDFLRVSRTYALPTLAANVALDPNGLDALGDLDGVSLAGQMDVAATAYFTIAFGVDSAGFYLLPGNGVLASVAVSGNVAASIPGGDVRGNAALGFAPEVRLSTTSADGRIRLADLDGTPESDSLTNRSVRTITGDAGVTLEIVHSIDGRPLEYGGSWVWELATDGSGFTLDETVSGIDQDAFANSLTELIADGLDDARQSLADAVQSGLNSNLAFLDSSVVDSFAGALSGDLSLDLELGSAQLALAESGFQLVSLADAGAYFQAVVKGTSLGQDLIQVRFARTASQALSFDLDDLKDYLAAALPSQFNLDDILPSNIDITASVEARADVTVGVAADGTSFLRDVGAGQPDEFSMTASITLDLERLGGSVGPLYAGVAQGTGELSVNMGVDLVASTGGGRVAIDELAADVSAYVQSSVSATAELDLPLAVRLGETGPGFLTSFSVQGQTASPIAFTFGPGGSTNPQDGFGPIVFEMGDMVRDAIGPVLKQLRAANPLPDELVDLVTSPLPIYGRSVLDLLKTFDSTGQYDLVALLFEISKVIKDLDAVANSGSSLDLSAYGFGSAPSSPGAGSTDGGDSGPFDDLLNKLAEYDVRLPILEDTGSKVLSMIFDPNVELDLIVWDPERFELATEQRVLDIPFASYGIPFVLEIRGTFIVDVRFGLFGDPEVGFTTRGITQTGNFLDGFYLGDNFVDGMDKAELGVLLEVQVGVAGQAYVFSYKVGELTVEGGLSGEFGVDLVDWDGAQTQVTEPDDYRLYRDEIAAIIDDPSLGMSCLFVLTGSITPFIEVGYEISDKGTPSPADLASLAGIPTSDSHRENLPGINWTDAPCSASEPVPLADAVGDVLQMRPLAADDPGQKIDVRVRKDVEGNPVLLRLTIQDQGVADPRTRYQDFDIDANGDVWAKDVDGNLRKVNHLALVGTPQADAVNVAPAASAHFDTFRVETYDGADRVDFGDYSNFESADIRLTTAYVWSGPGEDRVYGTPVKDVVEGGDGADRIYGNRGDDDLRGGGADDIIHGHEGNDYVLGGAGNDTLYGNAGDDTLDGENGADRIYGNEDDDSLVGGTGEDWLIGGDGNDTLRGGADDDALLGNDGNDKLFGDAGEDFLYGDNSLYLNSSSVLNEPDCAVNGYPVTLQIEFGIGCSRAFELAEIWYVTETPPGGEDELHGGAGDDWLEGGVESDTLYGDDGDDRLYGSSLYHAVRSEGNARGDDTIYGGAGNDILGAANGDDLLYGDAGDDRVHAGSGDDEVHGGADQDQIDGGTGHDRLYGDAGDDVIEGGEGNDSLEGGAGADQLWGGRQVNNPANDGVDTLRGGDGPDTLYGQNQNDSLYGDAGSDTLFGASGNDRIEGGADDDVLHGDAGDDHLSGDAGSDTLYGYAGNDQLFGHSESGASDDGAADWLYGEHIPGVVFVGLPGTLDDLLEGGAGPDHLDGGVGDDRLFGHRRSGAGDDAAPDHLLGQDGDDLLYGQRGDDQLEGGDGLDALWGGDGDDRLDGGADDDLLRGEDGADTLGGGAGDDVVYGDAGQDTLRGDGGSDYLDGGIGVDWLYGGAGDDHLQPGEGVGGELHGDDGDDLIFGTDGGPPIDPNFFDSLFVGDRIYGGTGDDRIFALGGADYVNAGAGNDWVDAGFGADYVLGGIGDDALIASDDLGDTLDGGDGDDRLQGSHLAGDVLIGGLGDDLLQGYGGADSLSGGLGADSLDGGADADTLDGDEGNDILDAGGGAGDLLRGGAGDDVLYGANDGADLLLGGPGRDRLLGRGGNDELRGESGDDILDGGDGDDLLVGGSGSDLLVGGAHHDTLYGHDPITADDDGAVDTLYGDFGTNGDEPLSGRDRLYGQGGNDLLFGEGNDDLLAGGAGVDNRLDYGSGEGANPTEFVAPSPTPAPTIQPGTGRELVSAALPVGAEPRGRWSDLFGSSTIGFGAESLAPSLESSLAVGANGAYVAWVDGRTGNLEIYVARLGATGWEPLGDSTQVGGVSRTAGSSRKPQLLIGADGQPLVVWNEVDASGAHVYARRWDPTAPGGGSWVEMAGSASGAGIGGAATAEAPSVVLTELGPVVGWLDRSTGVANVYLRRFNGLTWASLGASAAGGGVSAAATSVAEFALATDGVRTAVAWSETVAGKSQIRLREWTGTTWSERSGSASGNGVSQSSYGAWTPTAAYFEDQLFVAWRDEASTATVGTEVYVARHNGVAWTAAGAGSNADAGVSQSAGGALTPRFAVSSSGLSLAWIAEQRTSRSGEARSIQVRRWNGAQFEEQRFGDARGDGVLPVALGVHDLVVSADDLGRAYVGWLEPTADSARVRLLGDLQPFGPPGATYIADGQPGKTLQELLDAYDLGPGDTIVVRGVSSGPVTIGAEDSGVLIIGEQGAKVLGTLTIQSVSLVTLQDLTFSNSIAVNASTNVALVRSFAESISVNGGEDVLLREVNADSLVLQQHAHAQIEGSVMDQVRIQAGVVDVQIRASQIGSLTLANASSGRIERNSLTTLLIQAPFDGPISDNDIGGSTTGVFYGAAANLSGNRIHGASVGVVVQVADPLIGLGFVGAGASNVISGNAIGVDLRAGRMQNQRISDNSIGVIGAGVLGGDNSELANVIDRNAVGAQTTGTIQFNRFSRNATAVAASDRQTIAHNTFDLNGQRGIAVEGRTDVRILQNSFFALAGDNVRIFGESSEIELRGNAMWAETGYNIYVADDSQRGFFSDYNALHAGPIGKLVHWVFDFADLLDWQADVARFDLHSLGTTVVNPAWATPQYVAPSWGDLRTFAMVARQRGSSPTTDASDPRLDQMSFASFVNLLANPSFELGVAGWTTTSTVGAGAPSLPAYAGANHLAGGETAVAEAKQTIDLISAGFTPEQLDSGDLTVSFGGRLRSLDEAARDYGQVRLVFLDAGQQVISTIAPLAYSESQRWELTGERAAIPAGTRAVRFEFIATRRTGPSNDAWFDNGFVYIMPETYAPDLGAWGAIPYDESTTAPAHLDLQFPDLYVDWERDVPHEIRWRSLGNATDAQVRIDLYQDGPDGPAFLANLAAATEDDGSFSWTPANSGVSYGAKGLRIQVSSTANSANFTRSVEPFVVPENTTTFFVNDRSAANDEYTTVIGDNRQTGKLASQPKPSPANLLRTYSLGPTHQLFVDAGTYSLFETLVLSGNGTGSDDEGFVFTGPTSSSRTALLRHALPSERSVLELDDADSVTLAHLTLQSGTRGLWAYNSSTQLVALDLRIPSPSLAGIFIESGSSAARLERIVVTGSGGYGILVEGTVGAVTESRISGSRLDGLRLQNSGASRVEANEVFENREAGIVVWNGNAAAEVVIGNADLSLGRGNRVYNNLGHGIQADGRIVVAGNTVWGHQGTEAAGISISAGAEARRNVIHANYFGVQSLFNGVVEENRVYGNEDAGIRILAGGFARRNVVYSNARGVDVDAGYGNWPIELANNLVYGNSLGGVRLRNGAGAQVLNNTIVQMLGNALELADGARDVSVYNNILAATAGFALSVSANSQVGFQSDFNLYQTTGAGRVARWQGVPRPTLASWQAAALQDLNGLAQDPRFVDMDGADGVLGYVSAASDGRDDDFHLQSLYGSAHGGALAPVRHAASGLPVFPNVAWSLDAWQSPGIDRAREGDPVADEPAPHGGFRNLGAYGGTEQASLSPAEFVTVFRPDGGETWPAEQTIAIRWRASDISGTADVELIADDGAGGWTTVELLADDIDNDGEFAWTISSTTPPGEYAIRVTTHVNGQSDESNAPFQIRGPVSAFYVNVADDEDLSDNQYTSAPGVDGNDGLSPATPMASLAALLAAYDLEPGDVVYVDSGRYELFANIRLEEDDSGVVIQGPTGAGLAAVLDRANASSGSYVFEFAGADDVAIMNLTLTGAEVAVMAPSDAGSDRLSLLNNHIYGQGGGNAFSGAGASVEAGNVGATIVGNFVHDNGYTGIQVEGADAVVRDNRVSGNELGIVALYSGFQVARREILDNIVFDNRSIGVYAGDDDVTVAGNVVYGHASSASSVGIQASDSNVLENTVFANSTGIRIDGFTNRAESNRAYANRTGIVVNGSSDVAGNTVYSNSIGIDVESGLGGYRGRISNNLLYDQSNTAMRLTGARPGSQVLNNTFWQPVGDGVRFEGSTSGVWLRNNIFAIDSGIALDAAVNSQVGIDSDYNLFDLGPTARAARWGTIEYSDVGSFAGEVGRERHSLVGDPQFVNVAGADESSAFGDESLSTPRVVNDFGPKFTAYGQWYPLQGLDDDYFETGGASGTATATYEFSVTDGEIGERSYSASWPRHPGLGTAMFSVSAEGPVNVSLVGEASVEQGDTDHTSGTIHYSAYDVGNVKITLSMSGGNIHFDRLNGSEEDGPGLDLFGGWKNLHVEKDVHRVYDAEGDEVGEWTIDDLEVGETYALHALWDPSGGLDYQVRYEVWDGDVLVGVKFLQQTASPSAAENAPLGADNLGFYRVENGPLRVRVSAAPGTTFLADAVRLRHIPGDRGMDDNLRVAPTSITVDQGDPQTYFVGERLPHGARVNLGYDGNTPEGAVSFVQTIQVQTPNGGEKLEAGQSLSVDWLTSGILAEQPIALINVGGPAVDNWLFDDYVVAAGSSESFAPQTVIELPVASSAADAEVYRTYRIGDWAEGGRLAYHLPSPDGTYTVRLHFVEPWANDVGARVFDVVAQGATQIDDYDIVAAAGGIQRVDVRSFTVAASAGQGISLELIRQGDSLPPVLSAIEVWATNPLGVADPRFDVELSLDQGQNWSTIAAAAGLDRYGRGSVAWSIPAHFETNGLTALTRVRYAERQDESDRPFAIANGGTNFYVNIAGDTNFADNEYTTSAGSDLNNGKSPDRPMATLGALLRAYDLEPGDVVYVDSGVYSQRINLRLEPNDSGVWIQGPTQSGHEAVFDRGNRSSGSYVFEFAGADEVTLSHLAIIGADVGVFAGANADSDRLVVRESRIEDHGREDRFFGTGIQIEASNDEALLENNVIRDSGYIGISFVGANGVIRGNSVTGAEIGIELPWSGFATAPRLVEQNRVYANVSQGIRASDDDVRVQFNEVFSHRSETGIAIGIEADFVADNLVYDNDWGILASGFNGVAARNRIFHNDVGIRAHYDSKIVENRIYSNTIGITTPAFSSGRFTGQILNNVIYANAQSGVWLQTAGDGAQLSNNTIYQPLGDAVRLDQQSANVELRNNILFAAGGYAVNVDADSQVGFDSDYNLFHISGAGKLGRWQNVDFVTLDDWARRLGADRHGLVADPLLADVDGVDNVLGFAGGFDRGLDDDFRVLAGSPTLDRGDPTTLYFTEPTPNGGRVNLGADGGTSNALPSSPASITLTGPQGYDRVEAGETALVSWVASGLGQEVVVAAINVGGGLAGDWIADRFARESHFPSFVDESTPIDVTAVANAAPPHVYRTFVSTTGVGSRMGYQFPLADGDYEVRLHFIEPWYNAAGERRFDIRLQDAVVQAGFDPFAAAGAVYKAVARSFDVVVGGGQGLSLELVSQLDSGAILSGIEITQVNLGGVANPTVNVEASLNNGATWTLVAQDVALDRWGRGSTVWNVPAENATTQALVRVASPGGGVVGVSNSPFQIAPAGQSFYINDVVATGDRFTTAAGDDAHSGKSPSSPMRDLYALLSLYDLGPGDVVYVDAGAYDALREIMIGADDSGVRIVGASPTSTVINRRRSEEPAGSLFVLSNADDVSIERLGLTGADTAVELSEQSDSDRLRLLDNHLFGNRSYGVLIAVSNDDALVSANRIHDTTGWLGIALGYGVSAVGSGTRIVGNELFGNRYGVSANSHAALTPLEVVDNTIYDNEWGGIQAYDGTIVSGNVVYNHLATEPSGNAIGIEAGNAQVRQNIVHSNDVGIYTWGGGDEYAVSNNRLYNNEIAIQARGGTPHVVRNVVYSNSIGLEWGANGGGVSEGLAAENLFYQNSNGGILVAAGDGSSFINNTVYQTVGDALSITGGRRLRVLNNLLWVDSGFALAVSVESQEEFASNFNLFQQGADPNALAVKWGDDEYDLLSDWQFAAGLDAGSLEGDPLFIDRNGADNRFGYDPLLQIDGGLDDNFHLTQGSPAIDRGDGLNASPRDLEGNPRRDDDGAANAGRMMYLESPASGTVFQPAAVGTAQNWRADDAVWSLALPFDFPFYETTYSSVFVSSNGLLQFGGAATASGVNSTTALLAAPRIAALWDDLTTAGPGDDVFVDSTATEVAIRWNATHKVSGADVQFTATLSADGRIRFDFGRDNVGLSPTVGISAGDGVRGATPEHDGRESLMNARSIEFARESEGYGANVLSGSQFSAGGAGQAWQDDDSAWSYDLPFAFPLYGVEYQSVFVSSNGLLHFAGAGDPSDYSNSEFELSQNARIAPLWTDLRTTAPDYDIFVETQDDWVSFRWSAAAYGSDAPVNFAATLFADGQIRFDYGAGNQDLAPTIGVSAGDGENYLLVDAYDGADDLENAASILIAPSPNMTYVESVLERTQFYAPLGTAQSWTDVNSAYTLNLPFAFPLGDASYSTVQVSPNGVLHFDGPADPTSTDNSLPSLIENRLVAPLWQAHWMDGQADDIYVDDSQPDQVVILWDVSNFAGEDVRFAATLFADGRVRFDYGGGQDLAPRVGISNGDGVAYLSSFDQRTSLAAAGSLEYEFGPSFVDVGAHEFQGSSLDATPPTVVSAELRIVTGPPTKTEIQVLFSEAIDPIDARAPANYELWEAGLNGVLGDGDDVSYGIAPRYEPGTLLVTLDVLPLGTVLTSGRIRLVVHGDSTIHDLSGIKLDGDGDNVPGGNFVAANRPPVVATIADASIDEGSMLDFLVAASDPDSDTLRFELQSGAPVGATLDASTGRFQWTPGEADAPATYVVTVVVRDDGVPSMAATQVFTITANEVNDAPIVHPVADQTARDGAELTVAISAIDPEMDALAYSLDNAPDGAAIDSVTGLFRWTPSEAQSPGDFTVSVRVTDDGAPAQFTLVSFDIVVSEENQPPQWNATPSRTISEGVAFQTTLAAVDPEGGVVDYEFVGAAPTGAVLHPTTGVLNWTPTEAQGPSVQTITVRATDRGSPPRSATTSFTLTVLEVNATPAISPIASQAVQAGQTLTLNASASDADIPVNQLTFTLAAGAPAGATIHAATGAFSWTPTEAQVGDHSITVRVADNGTPSRSNTTTFVVSVLTAANESPTISGVADQSILEDGLLAPVSFVVGDAETASEQLTVTAVSSNQILVPDSAISLAGTGAARTIRVQPVADRNGSATITITVSDGENTTSDVFVLEVTPVNDAPSFTLTGDPAATLANSGPVEVAGLATAITAGPADESSQTLQFELDVVSSTGNLTFASGPAVDRVTGALTYEPSPNSIGTATIAIRLVDSGSAVAPNVAASESATFVIEVRPDKWTNYVRVRDVDRDGFVIPRDALLVINELNQRVVSGLDGRLPPPSADLQPPPFYDVTGDGFVTPADALTVINFLNGFGEGESLEGVGVFGIVPHQLDPPRTETEVGSTRHYDARRSDAPRAVAIDAVWQLEAAVGPLPADEAAADWKSSSALESAADGAWDESSWLDELLE
ncbi:MAG: right-handed parallel beta-helix repeat-containing protein [Pirellulales bacterium]